MTGKQLKNSILQWAIQGKLVPQDPNDEPASVLLEKIRAEKARLVKEGKIKKDKKESIIYRGEDNSYYEKFAHGKVVCIDDEIPFEIPTGWEWCRLKEVIQLLSGRDLEPSQYNNEGVGIPYMTGASNFTNDKLVVNRWTKGPVTVSHSGDLLITCKGTIGTMSFNDIGDIHIARQIMGISSLYVNLQYVKLFLEIYVVELQKAARSIIPGISRDDILSAILPLPPTKEQKRIVDKINEILPIVKRYSIYQIQQDELNSKIKSLLRKSILQEAIQGKLIPQDPNDEPASVLLQHIKEEKLRLVKEGKLKKKDVIDSIIFKGDDNKYFEKKGNEIICLDEEIPFAIPDTWVWVRLDDICEYIQRGKSPKYSPIKKYPVIAQKCNQWSGFSIDKAQFIVPETISSYGEERKLQDRDLLWNSTGLGTLGRMAIYYTKLNPYELAVADSHVTVIRAFKQYVCPEYLYAYFTSYTVQSVIEDKSDGSTKQKELATNTVKAYLVPLPPYEEQKRIVNRIDEIFPHLM